MPTQIRAVRGDITTLAVDAVVNAANSTLLGGGDAINTELWVPAEELEEFNRNIAGLIEVAAEFRTPVSWRRCIP